MDRLGQRARPPGEPVIHQRWDNLLFLHWAFKPAQLRPLIPEPLQIDTFNGRAWISVSPFHVDDVRPSKLPTLPSLSSFHELNVRTYVVHNGVPGIWFFSLDASKILPTVAARTVFMLPYYKANIRFLQAEETFAFNLKRNLPNRAEFRASWKVGTRLRDPDVNSLTFFLVERYCCFAVDETDLYEVRVYHHPWILDEAHVDLRSSTMIQALGIPEPSEPALTHFSRSLEVEIWPPVRVGSLVTAGKKVPIRAAR